MLEEWRGIRLFPDYSVSDSGSVRNDDADRLMTQQMNQRGIVHVGLTKNKVQHRRALSILVADAFLRKPNNNFNTPINLDGDRRNNEADNLLWRPRWFASQYYKQFESNVRPCFNRKVQVVETEEIFDTSWEAAISLGVLDRDIAMSVLSGSRVRIILQHFRLLK